MKRNDVIQLSLGLCMGYILFLFLHGMSVQNLSDMERQYLYEADVISNGDKASYDALQSMHIQRAYSGAQGYEDALFHRQDELLYHVLMANRYKNAESCYKVYNELVNKRETGKPDTVTLNLGLDYLKYGANLGDSDCQKELVMLYEKGKYVGRDSLLADSLRHVYGKSN